MSLRVTAAALACAIVAAVVGAHALAPESASAAASSCATLRPTHLELSRSVGRTVATLRWHTPRHARTGLEYRVTRGGAVVGQTPRPTMQLRVRIGATHRFTVVPVDAGKRLTRCALRRSIKVRYRRAGAPRHVTAKVAGATVRLGWKRSRRGDRPLAGYRVYRDGALLGQRRQRSRTVRVSANRTYRFQVAAVDRGGQVGKQSRAVTVKSGTGSSPSPGAAPSAPTGVQAVAIDDSRIGLTWNAGASGARIVGYRVLRNGSMLGQFASTSTVVDNLAPSTNYSFTVVAVDSRGRMSPESAPASARTADPTPTSGNAHAFLLASTDRSFADFRAHYQQIGTIYPSYYDCTADTGFAGQNDPLVTGWAQARKVRVLPRVNCQNPTVLTKILRNPSTRATWLSTLTQVVADNGYDGLALDFEAGVPEDRDVFTAFVSDLAARLHAIGKALTITVSAKRVDDPKQPRAGFYDYQGLDASADTMFVMDWGIHWATSKPGAEDDLSWATQVADYVASLPHHDRYVLGTLLYGMVWPDGGGPAHPGVPYEYEDVIAVLQAAGATPTLDPVADAWHATYTDSAGVVQDAWYADATTIANRIRLAHDRGLEAVGFWRLGREDQRIWDDPLLAPGVGW